LNKRYATLDSYVLA